MTSPLPTSCRPGGSCGPVGQSEVHPDRGPALQDAGSGSHDEVAGQRQREAFVPRVLLGRDGGAHRGADDVVGDRQVGGEREVVQQGNRVTDGRHRDAHAAELCGSLDAREHDTGRSERDAEGRPDLHQHRPVLGHDEVGSTADVRDGEIAEHSAVEHRLAVHVDRSELQTTADGHPAGQVEGLDAHGDARQVRDRELAACQLAEIDLQPLDLGADGPGRVRFDPAAEPQAHPGEERGRQPEPALRRIGHDVGEGDPDPADHDGDELGQAEPFAVGGLDVEAEVRQQPRHEVSAECHVVERPLPPGEHRERVSEFDRQSVARVAHLEEVSAGRWIEVDLHVRSAKGQDFAERERDRADVKPLESGLDGEPARAEREPRAGLQLEVLDLDAGRELARESDGSLDVDHRRDPRW